MFLLIFLYLHIWQFGYNLPAHNPGAEQFLKRVVIDRFRTTFISPRILPKNPAPFWLTPHPLALATILYKP